MGSVRVEQREHQRRREIDTERGEHRKLSRVYFEGCDFGAKGWDYARRRRRFESKESKEEKAEQIRKAGAKESEIDDDGGTLGDARRRRRREDGSKRSFGGGRRTSSEDAVQGDDGEQQQYELTVGVFCGNENARVVSQSEKENIIVWIGEDDIRRFFF